MTKWHVEGIDQKTGAIRALEVFAKDGADAHAQATEQGVHVVSVREIPLAGEAPPVASTGRLDYLRRPPPSARQNQRRNSLELHAMLLKAFAWLAMVTSVIFMLGGGGDDGRRFVAMLPLFGIGVIALGAGAICDALWDRD